MEIILLLIAGVVVYFLYNTLQEYLKNPIQPNQQPYTNRTDISPIDFQNPYEEMAQQDKIKSNEFSILAAILGYLVWSDKKMCALQEQLLDEILTDMAAESKNPRFTIDELKAILNEQRNPTISLEELCEGYVSLTKGEYKKRLKVVEFLFVLAYADGVLEEAEKDCILDIAALFEIDNNDFNTLFEHFEQEYAKDISMDAQRAKDIFAITELPQASVLTNMYNELIKKAKHNIFDSKNINKNFRDSSLTRIKEIDKAYEILLPLCKDESEKADSKKDSTSDVLDDAKEDTNQNSQTSNVSKDESAAKTRSGWDF